MVPPLTFLYSLHKSGNGLNPMELLSHFFLLLAHIFFAGDAISFRVLWSWGATALGGALRRLAMNQDGKGPECDLLRQVEMTIAGVSAQSWLFHNV